MIPDWPDELGEYGSKSRAAVALNSKASFLLLLSDDAFPDLEHPAGSIGNVALVENIAQISVRTRLCRPVVTCSLKAMSTMVG